MNKVKLVSECAREREPKPGDIFSWNRQEFHLVIENTTPVFKGRKRSCVNLQTGELGSIDNYNDINKLVTSQVIIEPQS